MTGFTSRQASGGLAIQGNAIGLNVVGDSPKWTGKDNGNWVVGSTGANSNWKLVIAPNTPTDYIDGDQVLFDDSATTATTLLAGTITVDISGGTVNPTTSTFNNSTLNYKIDGSTGGIAGSGSLTKNGTGSVTITASNAYTGPTTVNNGALTLSGSNINSGGTLFNGETLNLNSGSLEQVRATIAAGSAKTLDNTSTAAIVMTDNITQSWNDNFTFTAPAMARTIWIWARVQSRLVALAPIAP